MQYVPQSVPLTQFAQDQLKLYLRPGDKAIDATAGNGHDTLFLAQVVGPSGAVWALDIQPSAIEATHQRLAAAQVDWVRLEMRSHVDIATHLPQGWLGQVRAIMFNLGYLPSGNKDLTTEPSTTLKALDASLQVLAPMRACLSVMVYPGHPVGQLEAEAVCQWMYALPAHYRVQHYKSTATRAKGPDLWCVCY